MRPLPPLIAAMTRPELYPERPSSVELRQTHISWVFLAGDRVYKVKKNVRLAFLDYSTLDRRRFYCNEEVRLNRRLAPEVYLGVISILRDGERFVLSREGPSGAVEEYAVEMRRVPEESILERRVNDGRAGRDEMVRIADRLVEFHRTCPTKNARSYGSADAVGRMVAENLDEASAFVGDTLTKRDLDRLRAAADGFLAVNRDRLDDRLRSGRVCEGHGDLRAEHVSVGERIAVFDCVEFSEPLRTSDVASEVAFLAMDLDFLHASDLGNELLARYASRADDREFRALVPFYEAYRSVVRGKVESLKSREPEVADEERASAAARARRYFRLARRYARGHWPAVLVAVCGLSGTGKSTIAKLIEDFTGFERFGSDVVRKELAGVRSTERRGDAYRQGIYTREATDRTYEELARRAEAELARGCGAIVDATFQEPGHRRLLLETAEKLRVPVLFVECRAPQEEVRRRLVDRARRAGGASDATWETYVRQREEVAPFSDLPADLVFVIDTTSPEIVVADALEDRLDRAA